jgi:hypothetical protein
MDAVADLKLCLYLLPAVFVKTLASGYNCIIFKLILILYIYYFNFLTNPWRWASK